MYVEIMKPKQHAIWYKVWF